MEFLQLRYFFESAKEGCFSRTAEKFMVPLSSVSASIKRLEAELGCTLFDRHCNRIELNENGRILQNSLCMIFDELDHVTSSLLVKKEVRQEIKIAVRAIRTEIADYIIEYSVINPSVSFKTTFNFNDANIGDYDMIIDDNPDRYPGYDNFELCNKRMYLCVSSKSPLCGKKLKLRQLYNQAFVSTGEDSNSHKTLLNACNNEGFTPNFVVYTNDLLCYNKYIEAGIGIGITRGDPHTDNNIRYLDVCDFVGRQGIYVFYQKHLLNKAAAEFMDFLKSKAE